MPAGKATAKTVAEHEGHVRRPARGGEAGGEAVVHAQRIVAAAVGPGRVVEGHVVQIVDRQDIVAGAALHAVGAGAAVDQIVARPAVEPIVAAVAEQLVVAGAAEQVVIATAAVQLIVAGTAEQGIVADTAEQLIVARAAIQQVVARIAVDHVVARAADQNIVAGGALDHVIAVSASDMTADRPRTGRAVTGRLKAFEATETDLGQAHAEADAAARRRFGAAPGRNVARPAAGGVGARARLMRNGRRRPVAFDRYRVDHRVRRGGRAEVRERLARRCRRQAAGVVGGSSGIARLSAAHRARARLRLMAVARGDPPVGQQCADERGGQRRTDRQAVEIWTPPARFGRRGLHAAPTARQIGHADPDRVQCRRDALIDRQRRSHCDTILQAGVAAGLSSCRG